MKVAVTGKRCSEIINIICQKWSKTSFQKFPSNDRIAMLNLRKDFSSENIDQICL